jgi:hypothetical protein
MPPNTLLSPSNFLVLSSFPAVSPLLVAVLFPPGDLIDVFGWVSSLITVTDK